MAAEGFASRDVRLEKLSYGAEAPVARLGLGGMEERRLFADGGFRLLSCPFRDCLFEVVPKMTYDATIALRSLVGEAGHSPRRPSNQHTLDNLRFKSEAETRLNAMMYKKLKGTQVIYGQVRFPIKWIAIVLVANEVIFVLLCCSDNSTTAYKKWQVCVVGSSPISFADRNTPRYAQ